jgi:Transglycosylase-like domain
MRTKLVVGGGILTVTAILGLSGIGVLSAGAFWANDSSHPPHSERPAAAFDFGPLVAYLHQQQRVKDWVQGIAFAQILEVNAARARGGGGCAPGDFACFRACTIERETHGTYGGVSRDGRYHGAWQFDQRTWDANAAASGRPDLVGRPPEQASPADQDSVAYGTYSRRGKSPWGGRC